jgi:hypothetical protein
MSWFAVWFADASGTRITPMPDDASPTAGERSGQLSSVDPVGEATAPDSVSDIGVRSSEEPSDLFPPPRAKASALVRAVCGVLGVILILLGIVLGVLPVVPGFPLIAVGIVLLVAAGESSRRFVNRTERVLPRTMRRLIRRALRRDGTPRGSRVP